MKYLELFVSYAVSGRFDIAKDIYKHLRTEGASHEELLDKLKSAFTAHSSSKEAYEKVASQFVDFEKEFQQTG